MKKKIILAISVLMLSNLAMAAPAKSSVEASLSNLEAQLEKLTQLEEQKYVFKWQRAKHVDGMARTSAG